jgi:hypothetical protein
LQRVVGPLILDVVPRQSAQLSIDALEQRIDGLLIAGAGLQKQLGDPGLEDFSHKAPSRSMMEKAAGSDERLMRMMKSLRNSFSWRFRLSVGPRSLKSLSVNPPNFNSYCLSWKEFASECALISEGQNRPGGRQRQANNAAATVLSTRVAAELITARPMNLKFERSLNDVHV